MPLPIPMSDAQAEAMQQNFIALTAVGNRNLNREEQGSGWLAEQARALFLTRSQGNDLAQDILDQNSARNQPGQNPTVNIPTTGS